MKRSSPLKRGPGPKRSGFSLGARRGRRKKRINKEGKRRMNVEFDAALTFRTRVLFPPRDCERCRRVPAWTAHHMCLRSRCPGHPDKHNPEKNGAALCRDCHDEIHNSTPDDLHDWIKPLRWLDAGGRLQTTNPQDQ